MEWNDERAEELMRKRKKKMKGRWMCCTGVPIAAKRGWWLTQTYKELRAAETD